MPITEEALKAFLDRKAPALGFMVLDPDAGFGTPIRCVDCPFYDPVGDYEDPHCRLLDRAVRNRTIPPCSDADWRERAKLELLKMLRPTERTDQRTS